MPQTLTTRAAQQVTKGLGHHFQSPRRPRDKTKTQALVHVAGQANKRRRLAARLEQLEGKTPFSPPAASSANAFDQTDYDHEENIDQMDQDYTPSDAEVEHEEQADVSTQDHDGHPVVHPQRRILPDPPAQRLCMSWKVLIPTVIVPYLSYVSRTLGRPLPAIPASLSLCKHNNCMSKSLNILCLLSNRKLQITTHETKSHEPQTLSP